MIVALDYIFSCFLWVLHSNCFWLDNSSDIDVYVHTYFTMHVRIIIVQQVCTQAGTCLLVHTMQQQLPLKLGRRVLCRVQFLGNTSSNMQRRGTVSSVKTITKQVPTQFVNKPIHYLFTAFNVISIAFFLHFSLKLVCSMKIDDCLQILSKVICVVKSIVTSGIWLF